MKCQNCGGVSGYLICSVFALAWCSDREGALEAAKRLNGKKANVDMIVRPVLTNGTMGGDITLVDDEGIKEYRKAEVEKHE